MPPLISVIVPVYNGEKFIGPALEAVLAQPVEDIEVIVTDNASTDSTLQIAEAIAATDQRVRVVSNERNVGPMRNYQVGFDLASGTFVKLQAVDDYLDLGFLVEASSILQQNGDVALVVGAMTPVTADREPLEFDEARGGYITDYGEVVQYLTFSDDSSSASPSTRFRSVVEDVTGNLIAEYLYGLHRGSIIRQANELDVYLGAEKVFLAELLLRGRAVSSKSPSCERGFHPDHFGAQSFKATITGLDPDFDGRFAMPAARQAAGYAKAVIGADIRTSEKLKCLGVLGRKVTRAETLARVVRPGPQNYFGWGR